MQFHKTCFLSFWINQSKRHLKCMLNKKKERELKMNKDTRNYQESKASN